MRTRDPNIKSVVLYRLSYWRVEKAEALLSLDGGRRPSGRHGRQAGTAETIESIE